MRQASPKPTEEHGGVEQLLRQHRACSDGVTTAWTKFQHEGNLLMAQQQHEL